MKLLILTQTIDKTDSQLGFFHGWVLSFAKRFEQIDIICLKKGIYDFPSNVNVYSLGKENIQGNWFTKKILYVIRFYKLIWNLRRSYESVFVHMNQEYILLGGLFWRIFRKNMYMWRNHYDGSILTNIASFFCKKVFCTSRFSYTARFKKTVLMPVGVDESSCRLDESIEKIPNSILSLGRLDISKRLHILIEALGVLESQGIEFVATFVGGPSKTDSSYSERLTKRVEELGISDKVNFVGAFPNTETFRYYRSHSIFVNCSKSGMFDKTIFESVVCGCLTLVTSQDFKDLVGEEFIFPEDDFITLSKKLKQFLTSSLEERSRLALDLNKCIKNNNLESLTKSLGEEITN
ncbi:MAG: glycosyltransferase [Candidatus Pacebacteria bacterium]|nr:glycosyltransferase [Candidatus Paceibacterota bacterium]